MKVKKEIDLGEYIIRITYNDNGSGYLKVSVLDELHEEVEHIEIINEEENNNDINPNLN